MAIIHPCSLLPPVLWQGVPFGDKDAFLDWNGHHQAWHQALAKVTQTQYLAIDDLRDQLLRHSQMHAQLDLALRIPSAYDLVSYDLNERSSWEGFMQVHGDTHQRERLAAGI